MNGLLRRLLQTGLKATMEGTFLKRYLRVTTEHPENQKNYPVSYRQSVAFYHRKPFIHLRRHFKKWKHETKRDDQCVDQVHSG